MVLIKLIDPGGGFQSRLFGEVEVKTDKVCSVNEIDRTRLCANSKNSVPDMLPIAFF